MSISWRVEWLPASQDGLSRLDVFVDKSVSPLLDRVTVAEQVLARLKTSSAFLLVWDADWIPERASFLRRPRWNGKPLDEVRVFDRGRVRRFALYPLVSVADASERATGYPEQVIVLAQAPMALDAFAEGADQPHWPWKQLHELSHGRGVITAKFLGAFDDRQAGLRLEGTEKALRAIKEELSVGGP